MTERWDALRHDLGYALRQLRNAPGFTAAVAASFALGIGANATMFGIVDRLLLRAPAHIAAPERVVSIGEWRHFHFGGEAYRNTSFSYPAYRDYRDHVSAFAQVGAATWPADASLGRGERAQKIRVMLVSASYLALTGARPAIGRFFSRDEDREPDGIPVAVASYGFWQRSLGGERDVIGRTLDIGRRRYTIIGVAPTEFTGLQRAPVDVFLPITAADGLRFGGDDWLTLRGSMWLSVFGRLAPGATVAHAEAQGTAVVRGMEAARTDGQPPDTAASVSLQSILPGSDGEASAEARIAKLLASVSLLVLLIACANVANLLVARAVQRRREIAVRLALGAGRSRLVAQLVTEGVLLALLGGAAALLLVRWGGALIRTVLLSGYTWEGAGIDARMLGFTAAVAIGAGLLAAIVPALQASAPNVTRALRDGSRQGSVQRTRTRSALLLVQAALAVILLVGTGLFVRSFQNINAVGLGMETNRVLVATVDLPGAGFKPTDIDVIHRDLAERAQRSAGIASASVAAALPFRSSYATMLKIPGRDSLPQVKDGGPYVNAVTPEFFRTLGIRILRGRGFTGEDRASRARVMVVSESMARLFWPGKDPIGQCVLFDADSLPCMRIVGIAENTHRQGIVEDTDVLQYYVQLEHAPAFMKERVLFVRPADGEPEHWVEPVRRTLQSTAANLPYTDVRPMRALLASHVRPWRLGATVFGIFGGVALLLTALGLYSVISYAVAYRRHEMGVRVALGATGMDILALTLSSGLRVAATGVVLGVAIALWAGRYVESLLFEVSPHDPLIVLLVAGVLLGVAAIASLLPAVRAAKVDPLTALRAD